MPTKWIMLAAGIMSLVGSALFAVRQARLLHETPSATDAGVPVEHVESPPAPPTCIEGVVWIGNSAGRSEEGRHNCEPGQRVEITRAGTDVAWLVTAICRCPLAAKVP